MITVYNQAVDGFEEEKEFDSIEEAREYCRKYLGEYFDISDFFGYAMSGDGINKLVIEGTTWKEIFPNYF